MLTSEQRHEILVRQGWEDILSTRNGRAVINEIIGWSGVFKGDVIQNELIQFAAGRRDIGLRIIGEIQNIDPLAYVKILQDKIEEDKEIENEIKNDVTE